MMKIEMYTQNTFSSEEHSRPIYYFFSSKYENFKSSIFVIENRECDEHTCALFDISLFSFIHSLWVFCTTCVSCGAHQ